MKNPYTPELMQLLHTLGFKETPILHAEPFRPPMKEEKQAKPERCQYCGYRHGKTKPCYAIRRR